MYVACVFSIVKSHRKEKSRLLKKYAKINMGWFKDVLDEYLCSLEELNHLLPVIEEKVVWLFYYDFLF